MLDPKLIVTLGRYSMARFVGTGPMRDLHGRTREWNGITCLAMYHPAFILRTPTVELRRIYEEDFRKIPPLLDEAQRKRAALATASVMTADTAPLDQLRLF